MKMLRKETTTLKTTTMRMTGRVRGMSRSVWWWCEPRRSWVAKSGGEECVAIVGTAVCGDQRPPLLYV